jgi:hypothetical protein
MKPKTVLNVYQSQNNTAFFFTFFYFISASEFTNVQLKRCNFHDFSNLIEHFVKMNFEGVNSPQKT